MKDDFISKILLLQEQEEEIIKREKFIERISQRLREIQANIDQILEEQVTIVAELNNLIDQIREEELKVRSCRENLRKWEERAKLVKKAEEYKALLRERAKNEDCIIKGEQRLRELKNLRRRLESALQDSTKKQKLKRLEEEKEELLRERQEVEQDILTQRHNLESLKLNLGEQIVQEYEKLKREVGFPPLVKADRGVCTNCGTKLPTLLYSKLSKGESVRCPTCGKVLYH